MKRDSRRTNEYASCLAGDHRAERPSQSPGEGAQPWTNRRYPHSRLRRPDTGQRIRARDCWPVGPIRSTLRSPFPRDAHLPLDEPHAPAPRPGGEAENAAGYVLVLFVMMFFGLMGLAALVIDMGFARLAQRQMQTAVDSAALEGLRWQAASPTDSHCHGSRQAKWLPTCSPITWTAAAERCITAPGRS